MIWVLREKLLQRRTFGFWRGHRQRALQFQINGKRTVLRAIEIHHRRGATQCRKCRIEPGRARSRLAQMRRRFHKQRLCQRVIPLRMRTRRFQKGGLAAHRPRHTCLTQGFENPKRTLNLTFIDQPTRHFKQRSTRQWLTRRIMPKPSHQPHRLRTCFRSRNPMQTHCPRKHRLRDQRINLNRHRWPCRRRTRIHPRDRPRKGHFTRRNPLCQSIKDGIRGQRH